MSRGRELIPKPGSRFLRVKCPSCGNEQIVFDRAATVIQCRICGDVLVEPRGGRARVKGEILSVLE